MRIKIRSKKKKKIVSIWQEKNYKREYEKEESMKSTYSGISLINNIPIKNRNFWSLLILHFYFEDFFFFFTLVSDRSTKLDNIKVHKVRDDWWHEGAEQRKTWRKKKVLLFSGRKAIYNSFYFYSSKNKYSFYFFKVSVYFYVKINYFWHKVAWKLSSLTFFIYKKIIQNKKFFLTIFILISQWIINQLIN